MSATWHFVAAPRDERTVCGLPLVDGDREGTPLVFGDTNLWNACSDMRLCRRCSPIVARTPEAKEGGRRG